MFSDCRCCLITAFVGDNKLILIFLSYRILSTKLLKLTQTVLSLQSKPGSVQWVHQLSDYFVYVISFFVL